MMQESPFLDYYEFSLEKMNILLGIILNLLSLYLVKRFSTSYLGNYKHLLGLFALIDVYLCLLHALLNPIVIVIGYTMAAALYSPWQSHELSAFYYTCFSVPFMLMNIHFLYRYWSVAHPTRLALFTQPSFIAKICLYPLLQGSIWFYSAYYISMDTDAEVLSEVRMALLERHSAEVYDGWLVMDHWRNDELNVPALKVNISSNIIMFGSLSAAISLASLTYREIVKATTLSKKAMTIQYTLLMAVCAQTFVPLICVYIPYFLIITCPFLKLPVSGLADNFSLFVSIFPAWDAIVIIIMIREYRLGLARMFGFRKETKVVLINHTQFTTSVQPSTVS